jgi:hypothetical protein
VKEGRKYDLGALLITQQPGSIPVEILSQGDNWFVFHLLSGADLGNVRNANAHFSNDLLSALLNEPIPGHGVFWSSVGGTPYPISLRVLSFEKMYPPRDADYNQPAAETYARTLRQQFEATQREAGIPLIPVGEPADESGEAPDQDGLFGLDEIEVPKGVDVIAAFETRAIEALRSDEELMGKIRNSGAAWGSVKAFFLHHLPETLDDRSGIAYALVPKALNEILGPQDEAWHSFRNPDRGNTAYVRAGRNPER